MKAMEEKPEKRFSSVKEMLDFLVRGGGTAAGEKSADKEPVGSVSSGFGGVKILLFCGLILGFCWFYFFSGEGKKVNTPAKGTVADLTVGQPSGSFSGQPSGRTGASFRAADKHTGALSRLSGCNSTGAAKRAAEGTGGNKTGEKRACFGG